MRALPGCWPGRWPTRHSRARPPPVPGQRLCWCVCFPICRVIWIQRILLRPNTPQRTLSAPDQKGHKTGLSGKAICLHLAGLCLEALVQLKVTSPQVCHPVNSTILRCFVFFFFPHWEIWLGLKRSPGPKSVLIVQDRLKKWVKIPHEGCQAQEAFHTAPVLVNYTHSGFKSV